MTLAVDIRHRLGNFALDTRFTTGPGLTALFGRSGSGKTSVVNAIAGLLAPAEGLIRVGDTVLVDTSRNVFVPPHRRRVGYVFQEARLFPHISVRQNLLYGHWFLPRSERTANLDEVVDLLGIERVLDRKPGRLSGGEKQRVALGRALLANPRLLLMDEPLAALDEGRKAEIFPYIERLRDHSRVPIVYVSHSPAEVVRLASTIVVLDEGRVAAAGPTAEIMGRVDLFPLIGREEAGAVIDVEVARQDTRFGLTELRSAAGLWKVPRLDASVGEKVRLRVRSRDVMLSLSAPENISALNVHAGVIADISSSDGATVEVRIDCNGEILLARLTRYSIERLNLAPGTNVYALIKTVALDRRSEDGPFAAVTADA